MQPRHRWPATGPRPRRRAAGGLAVVALALPLVLLAAPAALAAQSQPETVPGGEPGTRFEMLAIGLAVGGILVVGGIVLVLFNRPQRSRVAGEDAVPPDEEFPEDAAPDEALAYGEAVPEGSRAYYGEPIPEAAPEYYEEPVPEDAQAYYDEAQPAPDDTQAYAEQVPEDATEDGDLVPDEARAPYDGEALPDEALAHGEAAPEDDRDDPRPAPAPVDSVDERLSGS